MQSILSAEYVPSNEILQPKDPALLDLHGAITDLSVLRGGFTAAHALFGITDSVDNVFKSRQAPTTVMFPYRRTQAPTRFTCNGDSDFAKLEVYADVQSGAIDIDRIANDTMEHLHEVASRLACASMLFRDVHPHKSHRLTVQDAASPVDYRLTVRARELLR